ncbi:MAG TPA: class I SAM-dependent methyltransferase [Candidatus Dormibacteraeota bacterium]
MRPIQPETAASTTYVRAVFDTYASVTGLDRPLQSKYDTLACNFRPLLAELPDDARVLDIGSGQGELLMLCRQLGIAAEGVDVSAELVEANVRRGLRVTCIDRLQDYLAACANEWDAVFMIDVLEHFAKAEAFEILGLLRARALKRGGVLVVQVPNMASPFATLNLYHDITHEWSYTPTSIAQILRVVGFANVRVRPANYPMKGLSVPRAAVRKIVYLLLRALLVVDQPNRTSILTPNLIAVAARDDT